MNDKARERRRALKAGMHRAQLDTSHTEACSVLPDRSALLKRLPSNGVAAEMGVAFGDFTCEILRLNQPRRLHLIDMWDSDRYESGLEKIRSELKQNILAGQVHIHQSSSIEALESMADSTFDWVYIDTNHSFDTTWQELILSSKKVKPSGRIAGHDFCTGNVITPVPYGVIEACNRFCVEYGWQYEYITLESHGHFSFCLRRM